MKKFKRDLNVMLFCSILFTIFFPVGVLCIIFGAIKNLAILPLGIILTVLGFYGSPILWTNYGKKRQLKIVLILILNENIYSIQELAQQTNKSVKQIELSIKNLIEKEYLTGYKLNNGMLELNTNKKQSPKTKRKQKCPQCGGLMEYDGINFVCEYCGNVIEKKEK